MLEHQKILLRNLCENRRFFIKELIKSMKWLNKQEMLELEQWVKQNFWNTHKYEIELAFQKISRYY